MIRFLVRRLAFLALTLLITSLVVFAATQLLPGDVARAVLGREAGEEQLEAFREQFGLDDPPHVQYGRWLWNFLRGEWGVSLSSRTDIQPLIAQRLSNSLRLAGLTLLVSAPLGIILGVAAGVHEGRWVDAAISVGSLAVVGLPEFITGLVLIQVFSGWLDLLPANSSVPLGTTFFDALPMLVLPALTATLVLLAYIARLTRASVVEELRKDYVRTAVLKGLPGWAVLFRHVLRNALLPTITVVAISTGWLISGLIVVENVFNYPGLGRLMVFAIDRRDLPLMQAIAMVAVLGYALANLAADLLYGFLNPRIRYR